MCEDLVDNKAFILDGEDGEGRPVVISVLLFLDGADGECVRTWVIVKPLFLMEQMGSVNQL